ncbi:hypothetical protein [Undibacterium sp. Ji49W]|uniref:hypothetical protein n=1 Tax=Undibacterium sp. Ji49W TaxID=3413040 RepID=UPI003BF047FE
MKTTLLQQLIPSLRFNAQARASATASKAAAKKAARNTIPFFTSPEHADSEMFNDVNPMNLQDTWFIQTGIRGATLKVTGAS